MRNEKPTPENIEARAILKLVDLGTTTLDGARELISVPEKETHALHMFLAVAGKDGAPIGRALTFRRQVLDEFEKLLESERATQSLPI